MAVVATDIAGFIECKSISEEVVIDKVYVSERFQGHGVGWALSTRFVKRVFMQIVDELDSNMGWVRHVVVTLYVDDRISSFWSQLSSRFWLRF